MLNTVHAPEIADKVFGGKTVQLVHYYKKQGHFPRPSYKLLGERGQELWFTATVEKWLAEYLRLTEERPDLSRSACMSAAAKAAEKFDSEIKLQLSRKEACDARPAA